MIEKERGDRQIEDKRNAASAMLPAPSRVSFHRSGVTDCTDHHTVLPKHRVSNRNTCDLKRPQLVGNTRCACVLIDTVTTLPIADFAATNVVSAPHRVLASRFSALGVPSPWRNLRVHRVSAGGRDRDIDPNAQLGFCSPPCFHTKCLFGRQRNRKTENRGSADGDSVSSHFHFSIFQFRFGRFER